jgi:hypothetical protein
MWKHLSILLTCGFQLILPIAFIAWGIAYGYEAYQGDRCNEAFASLLASNQVRINNVQARIDKVHAREAAVQARVAEIARKFNGPVNDGK